ncbi:MAG: hypothetical protein VCC99_01515 [Alphaproteobacteria bacterium]
MSDQEQARVKLVREFRPDLNASTEERVAAAMEQFAIQASLIEKRLANIEAEMRNAQNIMRAQLPPQQTY